MSCGSLIFALGHGRQRCGGPSINGVIGLVDCWGTPTGQTTPRHVPWHSSHPSHLKSKKPSWDAINSSTVKLLCTVDDHKHIYGLPRMGRSCSATLPHVALLLILILASGRALGVIYVDVTDEQGLRAAVDASTYVNATKVVVRLPGGPLSVSNTVRITAFDVHIQGQGQSGKSTLQCSSLNGSGLLELDVSAAKLTLEGIEFRDCSAPALLVAPASMANLSVANCVFTEFTRALLVRIALQDATLLTQGDSPGLTV